jgi:hypothetical protein
MAKEVWGMDKKAHLISGDSNAFAALAVLANPIETHFAFVLFPTAPVALQPSSLCSEARES